MKDAQEGTAKAERNNEAYLEDLKLQVKNANTRLRSVPTLHPHSSDVKSNTYIEAEEDLIQAKRKLEDEKNRLQ